jgi:hypothetical protein
MGTVPQLLLLRTASPAHADFDCLSSGAPPVVVRLDVVPLPPRSSTQTVTGCLRSVTNSKNLLLGNTIKILFHNGGLNLLSQGSGCPLQVGTRQGLPGRALGRC